MTETRKIVRAFLASPGDLVEERLAAKEVVTEFNEMWAEEFGYQVELVGWEETVSGYGRPQALINQDLDRCDLFVGMMWKRWGTPPDSGGQYTSGFHEEFERSMLRRQDTGVPEVSLFFKRVDPTLLADPGKDLQAVIKFKEQIIEEKVVYFREFGSVSDIKSLIRKQLAKFIRQRRVEDNKATSTDESAKQLPTTTDKPVKSEAVEVESPLSTKGFAFLQQLVGRLHHKDSVQDLANYDIARFRLLSAAISKSGNDEARLGVHDANILFAQRIELDFGNVEMLQLLDTGLKNISSENTPLWYWFSKVNGEVAVSVSAFYAESAAETVGAIKVLDWLGIKPAEIPLDESMISLPAWFSENSSYEVRTAAVSYLGHHGSAAEYELIRAEYQRSDSRTAPHSLAAMIELTGRINGADAAAKLMVSLQFESLSDKVLREAVGGLRHLTDDDVKLASEHRNEEVRLAAIRELVRREKLDDQLVVKLLDDTNASIRLVAITESTKRGTSFSDEAAKKVLVRPASRGTLGWSWFPATDKDGDKCLVEYNKSQRWKLREHELSREAAASVVFDDLAYLVRAEKYFAKWSRDLRSNVDDQFAAYFLRRVSQLEELGTVHADTIQKVRDVADTTRKQLTRDALDILARKRDKTDLQRIRVNLESRYTPASVCDASYLEKHGTLADIQLLLDADGPGSGERGLLWIGVDADFEEAVVRAASSVGKKDLDGLLALRIGAGRLAKIVELIPEVVFSAVSETDLQRLLRDQSDSVRRAAVLKAVRSLSGKRIAHVLDQYMQLQETRYYNVIFWLDLGVSLPRKTAKRVSASASA